MCRLYEYKLHQQPAVLAPIGAGCCVYSILSRLCGPGRVKRWLSTLTQPKSTILKIEVHRNWKRHLHPHHDSRFLEGCLWLFWVKSAVLERPGEWKARSLDLCGQVLDRLDPERRCISTRLYRQHCVDRGGAFLKASKLPTFRHVFLSSNVSIYIEYILIEC